MATFRFKLHTGPVRAEQRQFTRAFKRSKLHVAVTGTEHVYVDVKGVDCEDAWLNMERALKNKGLRPGRYLHTRELWSCQRRR
jgi:hypothetical protein